VTSEPNILGSPEVGESPCSRVLFAACAHAKAASYNKAAMKSVFVVTCIHTQKNEPYSVLTEIIQIHINGLQWIWGLTAI